ncbi:MAG: apolipoprotein N-acyltransferase [Alphaproteobacteria bacterium]|nr:apolipoprotein N-acyltransferase [Alphaproteobacteria bacterium]
MLTGYASIGMTGLQPTIGVAALYLLLSMWWPVAFAAAYSLQAGPLTLTCLWVGAEALRSQVFPGIPVAQLAAIWSQTPIVQLTSILSVETLGAMTLCASVTSAFLLGEQRYRASCLMFLAPATLAALVGEHMEMTPVPMPKMPAIVMIDTAIREDQRWADEALPGYVADITSRTKAAFDAGADLVIWPEAAIPFFPDELKNEIWAARPPTGAYLALGMMVPIQNDPGRFWNSFVVLDSNLNEVARYNKRHLFPFGEYMPFATELDRWFGITTIASDTNAIVQGNSEPLMTIPGLPGIIVPQICYEGSFAVPAAAREAQGAYVINISNDAWWLGSKGAWFAEQEARLRAIEAGLPLIRAPNMREAATFSARGHRIPAGPDGS